MKKGSNALCPCAHSDDLQLRLSSEECSQDSTIHIPVWRKWENSHFGWGRKGNIEVEMGRREEEVKVVGELVSDEGES